MYFCSYEIHHIVCNSLYRDCNFSCFNKDNLKDETLFVVLSFKNSCLSNSQSVQISSCAIFYSSNLQQFKVSQHKKTVVGSVA